MPSARARKRPKLAFLGDNGVGKTALVRRLIEGRYSPAESTKETVQEHLFCGDDERGGKIETSIVDFAGYAAGNFAANLATDELAALVFVVDAQSRSLGELSVHHWHEDLETAGVVPPRRKILVIARVDEADDGEIKNVLDEKRLTEIYGFTDFIPTSAKSGRGIDQLRAVIRQAGIEFYERQPAELSAVEVVVRTLATQLCELVAHNPAALEEIEWRDLERMVAACLEKIGFEVTLTAPSKDGGKDVIARCQVFNRQHTFFLELKHWRGGGRPGMSAVKDFIAVNAREKIHGGIFLSSSGYSNDVLSRLSEINRTQVRLGDRTKIVSLCQHYWQRMQGVWSPEQPLPEILFEKTLR